MEPRSDPLIVVGAAILSEQGLLLVSKQAAPRVFYLPGGKPEPGESDRACLQRELREELGVTPKAVSLLETVSATAALERVPMVMRVYLAATDREPRASGEIAGISWWRPDADFEGTLAPAVADSVVPSLVGAGLLR